MAMRKSGHSWSPAEEGILRDLAGTMPAREIASQLAARGFTRTAAAVWTHAEHNGIDMFKKSRTANEVRLLFGVADMTVRSWVCLGLLRSQAYGRHVVFSNEEVRAFMRAESWAYDVDRMQPGPMRQLAAVVQRRDPWLRVAEAARMVDCHVETIVRHARSGVVELRQRPGRRGVLLVRASALPALKASYEAARARSRAHLQPGAHRTVGEVRKAA
jgi:hypothetical protein